jgi:apolipoprotein N-acyltransferase
MDALSERPADPVNRISTAYEPGGEASQAGILNVMLLRRDDVAAPFRARWAALITVGSGLLGILAFPRFGVWPVAVVSVAGLSVAVHGRRCRTAAWLGLLYGGAFFIPLLSWTGVYVGPAPWLILAAAEAGYYAGAGALLTLVQRLRAAPVWVGCVWVLTEAVRDRGPFGGFPWGRLAFSQAESPLRWFAALGGAPLVTFAVATAGGGLAIAVLALCGDRRRWRAVAAGGAVVLVVPLLGAVLAWPLGPPPDDAGRTTTVALIQGDVPDAGLEFNARRRQVLDNHVQQTLNLADQVKSGAVPRPDLVVWPENSSDIDPYRNPDAAAQITKAVDAIGVPVLVGAVVDGPGNDHVSNDGILWFPKSGPGAVYTKRHPVPWGEYIPLRGLARMVSSKVNLVSRDMIAGKGDGLLAGGPFPFGDVICFEVAYDSLVRSSVQAGAQLVVVQTNNATFGHTAETYQQLAMTQLRAVEHGRTTLQVSTSGISAVIGPDGVVRQRSGALFTPDVIVATVPLRTSQTLATALGPVPEYVLSGLALVAAAVSVLSGPASRMTIARRTRRRADAGEPADPERVGIARD